MKAAAGIRSAVALLQPNGALLQRSRPALRVTASASSSCRSVSSTHTTQASPHAHTILTPVAQHSNGVAAEGIHKGRPQRGVSTSHAAEKSHAVAPSVPTSGPVAEAEAVFTSVWKDLIAKRGGIERMAMPREIVWLSGAPGAGKGTMGAAVKRERDIAHIVEVSSLLQSPVFKALKERGELIGDREVMEALLVELLDPKYSQGVIVDGFPRTVVQAHLIVQFKQALDSLYEEYRGHVQLRQIFRRPLFQICVLYCSEEESVRRQLKRGQELMRLNMVAQETGVGEVTQARATDVDESAARKRYRIFKEEVFESLQAIKESFPFHFINADADPATVRKQIAKELHYQSSLDLNPDAYDLIHSVDSAHRVIQQARTKMVTRLNAYASDYPDTFKAVINTLNTEFIHIIKRQALAGKAVIRTNNPLLENAIAINMLLDVLAERGFRVTLDVARAQVPVLVEPAVPGDAAGQRVKTAVERTFIFRIEFPRPEIRRTEPL